MRCRWADHAECRRPPAPMLTLPGDCSYPTDDPLESPPSRHVDELRRPLLHLLAGANLAGFARILLRHGAPSPRSYMQVAIIFASAVLRWPGCAIEALRVARRAEEVSFDPPPVFIVGHWRSGTTLLHNLMSRDPGFCPSGGHRWPYPVGIPETDESTARFAGHAAAGT